MLQKSEVFNDTKTELSNAVKTNYIYVANSEVFNVTQTNLFNIAKSTTQTNLFNIAKSTTYLDVTKIKFYNVPETELFIVAEMEYLMSQKTYDTQYRWSLCHISNT